MKHSQSARLLSLLSVIGLAEPAGSQTILSLPDPNESIGERPYEMLWAKRTEASPPTVRFDQLAGWAMKVEGGAQATLQVSRAQNVWDRPVARLRYHGEG